MLRLLHVSDTHFGMKDDFGEQRRITSALVQAVRRDNLQPDICVFSGDLAFSGEAEQFECGQQWLEELTASFLDTDLVIVPGNHDVTRAKAKGTLLQRASIDTGSFADWRDAVKHGHIHLNSFFEWHKEAAKSLQLKGTWTSPFGFVHTGEKAGTKIRVIGLNSSVLSWRDGEVGKLAIDIRTINESLQRSNRTDELILTVCHHPFSDLAECNRRESDRLLSQETGSHLFLHGHLHEQIGMVRNDSTGQGLCVLAAGASYQGSRWPQFFASYEVDLDRREVRTQAYVYSENAGEWVEDARRSRKMPLLLKMFDVPAADARVEYSTRSPISPPRHTRHRRSKSLQLDGAISDRHELEARRLIKAAEHVQNKIGQYFADTPDIADMCYIRKTRIKSLKSIRRKVEAKISEGQEYGPGSLVDICGFRLITFYQSDIPAIIKHLIQATRSDAGSVTPFRTNAPVLIDINSSRPEIDPLSIVSEIKEAVKKLDPKIEINVTPRVTGYSSVHVIVSCPTGLEDGEVEEISVEVQVRSVLEDVWGELDHKLRYGSQRGGVGVSWARHLNALKTLLDGVIQYLDLIKRHAEEDRLVPPSEIKQARSVEEPEKQMNRLQALPEVIRERLNDAYELWAQADATRPLGGDPGLFRRAADAFLEIITTFDGQPEDDPELASELRYVSQAERAFMLSYTGDPDEVAESVRIYEEILKQRESNVTALFRLGHLTRRQGDLPRSMQLFRKAIDILERGEDERSERLDRSHWVYDATRLNLAVANWRIFQSGSDMAERATALTAAMDLAKSVVDKPADEKQRIRAMNDYLYYLWELQQVDVPAFKRAIRLRTFKAYCAQLKDAVQAGGYEAYEYHDTLMRVMQMVGDVRAAYAAALETRDALERLGRRVFPGITLPENKATYGWTLELTRHLDEDQRDALVYAQDVIRELSTG